MLAFMSWMAENIILHCAASTRASRPWKNVWLLSFLGWKDLIIWELSKEVLAGK